MICSFGAQKQSDGTWTHVPDRIPENWTNRVTPYSLLDVTAQILEMYLKHPVGFGGNANGAFVGLDFPPYIQGGNLLAATPADFACLLYQLVTGQIPSSLNGFVTPTVEALQFALTAIGERLLRIWDARYLLPSKRRGNGVIRSRYIITDGLCVFIILR